MVNCEKKTYTNGTIKFVLSLDKAHSVCVIKKLVNKILWKGTSTISFCSTVYVTHTLQS